MISAHHLIFNGFSTEDFDVIPYLSFSGDNGATPTFLSAQGVYTEHYDGHRTIHRSKYNEVFTPRFTLIKKDESDFDATENRKILSWITASEKPGFLEVYKDDSNVLDWKIFGCITSVEQYKLGNGRIIGYEFEVESSHPYAWSHKFVYPEVYTTTAEAGNNDETNDYLTISDTKEFTITCNTDDYNKLLYPKVTITFKGQNMYFPIDVNPLQENTYPMVPNVIYAWVEEYRKATTYQIGITYYSDDKGTVANPQPTSTTEITNGKYYTYVNERHYYVNLNGAKHNGRYIVLPSVSSIIADATTQDYKYYYFTDTNEIQTTVSKEVNGNVVYYWEPVAKIGMAVKIQNTYMLNGESATKETIIAGGAMDEEVILDGTNKLIYGTKGATTKIIGDHFNWEWIPFAYGENSIKVMGQCVIKFEWLEPRKVGSL